MYVLDEPSIGLHQRDNDRLLKTLRELSDLGNTLLVVEHDEDTLRQADWLCDLGPGGKHGGRVVAKPPSEVMMEEESITGAYLAGRKTIPTPEVRKKAKRGQFLEIKGAKHNNLKDIDVKFPLGAFTAITGVSGSGKSSLISETLAPALQRHLHRSEVSCGKHKQIKGLEKIDKAIVMISRLLEERLGPIQQLTQKSSMKLENYFPRPNYQNKEGTNLVIFHST